MFHRSPAQIRAAVFTACALIFPSQLFCAVRDGTIRIEPASVRAGASLDLTGEWLYHPGYAVQPSDQPETRLANDCVRVPVPQLLNRIWWWLDDSEDFKKRETERLKKLGFDTERAEDGWYYLRLHLPSIPTGKHVLIEFEGVAMISKTFCNGKFLGEHKGMFSRFSYELTPHLKSGDNLLAIFVSMEKIPPSSLSMGQAVTVNLTASKVRTMSKGMFGPLSPDFDNRAYDLHGIWQPVRLVIRGDAKLDDVWFIPSLNGAEVRVEGHSLAGEQVATLKATWTEPKSGGVFAKTVPQTMELGKTATTQRLVLEDIEPNLWSPAEPYLYRLDVSLESDSGEVLDSWSQLVGFRTFEARGNKFFLNGKEYWLRGANHLPYGKNPFDPELPRKLIKLLHDANIRVTRTHATPWNEMWLSAADEIGLGVSLEGIRPWALAGKIGATPPDLFAHWLMENEDVVKRARNHPSVLIYTVGNEMLLRDTKNLEKWKQLSEVVKQTRRVDPTRPVICSSEYSREPELYNELLKPNGIDDGDADDIHRYNNWYSPSSFVTDAKFEKEAVNSGPSRPLIGQEMSSGYPDLDNGLPVLRYTRDLLTPQAWIGNFSYPGKDPKFFLEHHRAVTKRWAERLRFERGNRTAGFMLFALECWFSHSYDAATVRPYPVVQSMREAFAPIGLALETGRQRFFPEEQLRTSVFVTNDDEQSNDIFDLRIELAWRELGSTKNLGSSEIAKVASVRFGETTRVPVTIKVPPAKKRTSLALQIRLMNGKKEISATTDLVEVIPTPEPVRIDASLFSRGLGPEMREFIGKTARFRSQAELNSAGVILLGPSDDLSGLETNGVVRKEIERGATAVLFSPGEKFVSLFSREIGDPKSAPGEFADWSPCAGTKLAEGLAPMDLKWWGRKNDWRVFVADLSHRFRTGSRARELIRFIPPHGYISAENVPAQYRTVLFEISMGKGRLWVCDLDVESSVPADPAAQRFALNLLRAAADPASTKVLPKVSSHAELLKGVASAQ